MRRVQVIQLCQAIAVFTLVAFGGSVAVSAEPVVHAKRTIIERLEDQEPRTHAKVADGYDYSVTRELLPPVGEGRLEAAGGGWITVVEAREIRSSSTAGSLPYTLMFALSGLALFAGSLVAFRRQWQPRLSSAISDMRLPLGTAQAVLGKVAATSRALTDLIAQRLHSDAGETDHTDAETENASAQVASLLNQIEQVVARLKDGSPLRDVLEQELRLIHYRISAATSAARNGSDSSEKSAARFRGLVRELERVRRVADSAAASVIDPRERLALPQTRSEAYALLGVNPDASAPVLKKLVDALRVTWHPDHARNESDRLLREERIKQINCAWDLINAEDAV